MWSLVQRHYWRAAVLIFASWAAGAFWLDFHGRRPRLVVFSPPDNNGDVGVSAGFPEGLEDAALQGLLCSSDKALAVIVPGCSLSSGGTRLGAPFESRMLRGVDILRALDAAAAGGGGKQQQIPLATTGGGVPSEAQMALDFAQAQLGVDISRTCAEHHSRVTRENAVLVLPEIARYWLQRSPGSEAARNTVFVVSDTYHSLRCGYYFGLEFAQHWRSTLDLMVGLPAPRDSRDNGEVRPVRVVVVPSESPIADRVFGALREAGAVCKNIILGGLSLHYVVRALFS